VARLECELKSSGGGWGSRMSISSEQNWLLVASTHSRLDDFGSDGIRALQPVEGPSIRKNSANHPSSRYLYAANTLATAFLPLWHTSCSASLHDADPSVEPGNQEAE